MRIGRENRRDKSTGALPALLAVLALVVQLLIPAASMAYEARVGRGPLIVMCTADGPVAVSSADQPDHGKSFGGLKCHDCVMASVAAVGADAPLSTPIRYAVRIAIAAPGQDRPQTRSRAPPRPPSTAPPVTQTA
ncbi:MAG: DUF2946 family protein [Pseudomonadota bacterium]